MAEDSSVNKAAWMAIGIAAGAYVRGLTEPKVNLVSSTGGDIGVLKNDVRQYIGYVYRQARIWRVIYYVERSLLIIFSVLTSAEALHAFEKMQGYNKSIFGLVVLLLTSFDVWLKPETKYKGYYQANDGYDELRQRIDLFLKADDENTLKDVYNELKRINARLQAII